MFGNGLMAKGSRIFSARLLTAAVQAIGLSWLTGTAATPRAWPATEPLLFEPLFIMFIYVPVLALFGLGQVRSRALGLWLVLAGVAIAGLGYHDVARGWVPSFLDNGHWPWFGLWLALSAGLFIAHVLVIDSIIERHLLPTYGRHFDTAWKQGVQAVLAAVFVGVFWAVLYLGASLFSLVDMHYFRDLIGRRWFAYPATTLALAVAIHVTDVQPALIRGARSLALTLLSWLLPLLVIILCSFLASLPFISLTALWKTHFATSLLLTAAGLLVFLINCCYQDGAVERTASRIKRLAGTIGSIVLVPLAALAIWALVLRVGQYGWSGERVFAAALTTVATCYAIGYSSATVWASTWLKRIEITNFATSYVVLLLLLALFTPLADPARLMVADQVARLKSGAITPEKFDFTALKFDGARWGTAALAELSQEKELANSSVINEKAAAAITQTYRQPPALPASPNDLIGRVIVYPEGRTLPASFYDKKAGVFANQSGSICFQMATAQKCKARFLSLHPGEPESILFIDGGGLGNIFDEVSPGKWTNSAFVSIPEYCEAVRHAIETGTFQIEARAAADIVIGDQRFPIQPLNKPCPPPQK